MKTHDGFLNFLIGNVVDSQVILVMPRVFGIGLFDVTKYVITIWVVALVMFFLLLLVFLSVKRAEGFVGGRVRTLFELFVDFVQRQMLAPYFHDDRRWTPFFLTLFLYIMLCNLFGLIPGVASLTANIGVTGALAGMVFVVTQVNGMRAHGILGYWRNLVPEGVPKILMPLLFVIEFVGLLTKPFSLTVRLFANMLAGGIIILILSFLLAQLAGTWMQLGVAPFVVMGTLAVLLLKAFVAILQAYIFTLLSIIFISSAQGKH